MAVERKTILLNGGRELDVVPVSGVEEFIAGLLAGAPAKPVTATLRVVKNAAGRPFVAVIVAERHVGFLSHADAQDLLLTLVACEQHGATAQARSIMMAPPGGVGGAMVKISLAEPDRLLCASQDESPPVLSDASAAVPVPSPSPDQPQAAGLAETVREDREQQGTDSPPSAAPRRYCPQCGSVCEAGAIRCTCGHVFAGAPVAEPAGSTQPGASEEELAAASAEKEQKWSSPPPASSAGQPRNNQQCDPVPPVGQSCNAPKDTWWRRHPFVLSFVVKAVLILIALLYTGGWTMNGGTLDAGWNYSTWSFAIGLVALLTPGWVGYDAYTKTYLTAADAWGWTFFCYLVWIVGFPLYLIRRREVLRRREGLAPGIWPFDNRATPAQMTDDARPEESVVDCPPQETWFQRHPWAWKLEAVILLLVVALTVWSPILAAEAERFDNKLACQWGDLYYTDEVPKADAERVGAYLEVIGNGQQHPVIRIRTDEFTSGGFDAGLDKSGNTFELRLIPGGGVRLEQAFQEALSGLAQGLLATEFPDAKIKIVLCKKDLTPYETLGPFSAFPSQ